MNGELDYDEFGFLDEIVEELHLQRVQTPVVKRVSTQVAPHRRVSTLIWGQGQPELVLIHGGSQNAHTWDMVALTLNRPLIAVDLPGHGHSDGPDSTLNGGRDVWGLAKDVEAVVRDLAPKTEVIVGMSLGGMTAIALSALAPELVPRLVLVDVLPGIARSRSNHISDFVQGPRVFDSLEVMVLNAVQFAPQRSYSSIRRGVRHNALQLADGTWTWRWARHDANRTASVLDDPASDKLLYEDLWTELSNIKAPVLLARGMTPDSILGDDDEQELRRQLLTAQVVHFESAGHSIQSDSPTEFSEVVEKFVFHDSTNA